MVTSLFVYGIIGVIIVTAGVWYVLSVKDRFFATQNSPVLAPFEVVGIDDGKAKNLGMSLPKMVLARLNSLKARSNAAIESLKAAKTSLDPKGSRFTAADTRFSEIDIPAEFTEPIDIDFKIADVELGWLVSLFLQKTQPHRQIQVTIIFDEEAKTSHFYGHQTGDTGYSFSGDSSNTLNELVNEISAAIIQRSVKTQEAALDVLDAATFETMIDQLARYATLEKSRDYASKSDIAAYKEIYEKIRNDANKWTRWDDLQWLASQVSERAELWPNALAHYRHIRDLTAPDRPRAALVADKIKELEQRLEQQKESQALAGAGEDQNRQAAEAAQKARRAAAAKPIEPARYKPILNLVGLETPGDAEGVRIGIIGGPPWPDVIGDAKVENMPDLPDTADEDRFFRDYISEVFQVVRAVAPNATFVFFPLKTFGGGGTSINDMLAAVDAVGESPNPVDIVVMTFGTNTPSDPMNKAISRAANKSLFVLAAGNEDNVSGYAGLDRDALVVGSVNINGAPSRFTSRSDNAVFAPGEDIPVVSPKSGLNVKRAGTTFSAAIAAGVAAVMKASHPQASVEALVTAIRDGATPATGRDKPVIVNAANTNVVLANSR